MDLLGLTLTSGSRPLGSSFTFNKFDDQIRDILARSRLDTTDTR